MTTHTETQAMCERLRSLATHQSVNAGTFVPDVIALLTRQQEEIDRLREAAKGSAVIVNVARGELKHIRAVLRNQTCLLGATMRVFSPNADEEYKGLTDFEIAASPAIRAALQAKPETPPMKHRHKWKPVWQSIRSGVIVAEDCVCECGAKRSEREFSKEATK